LFARLSSIVSPATVTEIATMLGISDQAASRGLALSTAAAFAGLAQRADDSDTLNQVIDAAATTRGDAVASAVNRGRLTELGAPQLFEGRRLLASVFGGGQHRILNAISWESGLTTAAAAVLLPLGAQSLLTFFASRIREDGLTAGTLAAFLRREGPEVRRALPTPLDEAITKTAPVAYRATETEPVVAQAAIESHHRPIVPWLMACAACILALFWFAMKPTPVNIGTATLTFPSDKPIGTSGHMPTVPTDMGIRLPDAIAPDTSIRFDLDKVLFNTGSATLRPQSMHQLHEAAAILQAHPNVDVTIAGHTDNVGAPELNMKLSQERATSVMKALEGMGVPADRLDAKGYGEDNPVADNSTESGRALNRRTTMEVTPK